MGRLTSSDDVASDYSSLQSSRTDLFHDSQDVSLYSSTAAILEDGASDALRLEQDNESKLSLHIDPDFSQDELVELEFLRDEEIDAFVVQEFLPQEERWNVDRRDGFHFVYPEMTLDIVTGSHYPVKALTYQLTNTCLPRVVIDQLRAALRDIHAKDTSANTMEKWLSRLASEHGCFEFEHVALHLAIKTEDHLKQYRQNPCYWNSQTMLQRTDLHLSFERRLYLYNLYGIDLLPQCGKAGEYDYDPERDYDPLNADWSKKLQDLTDEHKLILSKVQHQSEIKESMFGIDPSSVHGHDITNSLLGRSPEEVCKKITDSFRILHIENVVRSDLVGRFQRCQDRIRGDLEKVPLNVLKGSVKAETRRGLGKRANEKETLIDLLIKPEISFHCTREDLVPSIVRQGFLKPEAEKAVRCGSTYGRGIYSSPDPIFSLMYTDIRDGYCATKFDEFAGLKLIVCAAIMGRCRYVSRLDNWRNESEPWPGAHSHVANSMLEYVVFSEAQIIPCYVIHLDLGRDIARYITKLSANPTAYINEYRMQQRKVRHAQKVLGQVSDEEPGEIQRKKQALLAKAQKYFPYGYGTASGPKFAVLDVAEVSEDEEEYGMYQKDRVDGAKKVDIWAESGHKTFTFDSEEQNESEGASESDENTNAKNTGEEDEEVVTWEYQTGPEGRTKFDEYHEARKAKSKRQNITPSDRNS